MSPPPRSTQTARAGRGSTCATSRRTAARWSSARTAWRRPRAWPAMARERSASCPPVAPSPSATSPNCAADRACPRAKRSANSGPCRTSISRSWATTSMTLLTLDRRKAALVARRALRDAVSELRLILAMVGLTVAIPRGSAIGIRALAALGGGTAVVDRLSLVGAFFVVFIPASFSLVLALESFVGERERTTLEVLISTPLKESEIYAGKVAAVLAGSLGLCYGGVP